MSQPFVLAERIRQLPPYPFAKIDRLKEEELKKGKKLISLSIGDPDLPTPPFVVDRLASAAKNPKNHQYPSYWGMLEFRKTAASWFERRFQVALNPDREVLALIGSKEGIAHMPLAFVNPGEGVLVPNPGYPVYSVATQFAGGVPISFDLKPENGFLPDLRDIEAKIKKGPKIKLWFLNYPNNPTASGAPLSFFEEVVALARKYDVLVCHDHAYSEIYFDGVRPPSILQVRGAKDVSCEFHSLSKTFNMTGWRVGFLVGNELCVEGLSKVKTNMDSGIFNACQEAGISAMTEGDAFCSDLRKTYQARRDVLVPALREAGLACEDPQGTFYVWCLLPKRSGNPWTSEEYVTHLIREKGIVATPGSAFGSAGEGFVRLTLCSDIETLKQVALALRSSV